LKLNQFTLSQSALTEFDQLLNKKHSNYLNSKAPSILFVNICANKNRTKLYLIVKNWEQFKCSRGHINYVTTIDRAIRDKSNIYKVDNNEENMCDTGGN
jgi:hypothetical protein